MATAATFSTFDILLHHYPEILTAIASFLLISHFSSSRSRTSLPRNWPVLGMLPGLAANFHRFHDFLTSILRDSGFTFAFKGPWLFNMGFLITCDPSNINHILNTNFPNYVKGKEFAEIFDILGDGLFGADGDSSRHQRKLAQSIFVESDLQTVQVRVIQNKVEEGLVPFLDYMASEQRPFDLQDGFIRLTFDVACDTVLGLDLSSLSVEFPVVPFADAIDDVEEAVLMRQLMPPRIWKMIRWLNVGSEKKLASAWRVVDCFILGQIAKLREKGGTSAGAYDLMTLHMIRGVDDDKFLRDSALTFMLAGRDSISLTLSWFCYSVLTNPHVESKILNELTSIVQASSDEQRKGTKALVFDANMVQSAVYLHAALCETLRLYPPLPFDHKEAVKTDVLPSGENGAGGIENTVPNLLYGENGGHLGE